jgi:hypothetical protein
VDGTGIEIKSSELFKPDVLSKPEAVLVMGNIQFPVKVVEKRTPTEVRFEYMSHGQVLDTERYGISPKEFVLVEANSETYEPPISLLRFPMNVGAKWDWSGDLVSGDRKHKATAIIISQVDGPVENLPGTESLRIDVQLSIDSGAGKPAQRALNFWFMPNQGVVSRKFGFASTRIPPAKQE